MRSKILANKTIRNIQVSFATLFKLWWNSIFINVLFLLFSCTGTIAREGGILQTTKRTTSRSEISLRRSNMSRHKCAWRALTSSYHDDFFFIILVCVVIILAGLYRCFIQFVRQRPANQESTAPPAILWNSAVLVDWKQQLGFETPY